MANIVLGVDVGGSKILVGMVDREGKALASQRYPMESGSQESTLHSLEQALEDFLAGWQGEAPLAAGVGLVGHVDPVRGVWLGSINLMVDTPVPLAAYIKEHYGLKAALDNDVHAACLAEMRWGLGRALKDFIFLNIGTGIAAGLVSNGQLIRGAANYGGEIGHTMVEVEGEPCPCGRRGCLETLASGAGLLAQAKRLIEGAPFEGHFDGPFTAFRASAQGHDDHAPFDCAQGHNCAQGHDDHAPFDCAQGHNYAQGHDDGQGFRAGDSSLSHKARSLSVTPCVVEMPGEDSTAPSRRSGLRLRDSEGNLDARAILAASAAGDPLARQVVERAGYALGLALTNLVNTLNPQAIIYSGSVAGEGQLMALASAQVYARALPAARQALRGIWPTQLDPEMAGLLGAASLAWQFVDSKTQD